jgi:hypothetical protein
VIITLNETKSLLQITDTTKDTLITNLIPIVEQAICDYCNNEFIDEYFDYINSSSIIFESIDNSISLNNISNYKFNVNDSIRIFNSLSNNQTFTIYSISTNSIIVDDIDTIIDENEGYPITLTRIIYPKPLKIIAFKMIDYNLEKITPGLTSESIDDYSFTIMELNECYPKNILAGLNKYRKLYKTYQFGGGY